MIGPRRIAVVGTGGTISAWSPGALDLVGYTEGGSRRLSTAEILTAVPEAGEVADLLPVCGPSGPSHAMTLLTLLEIADVVRVARSDPAVNGIVVTHGTNTLEELAFLLALVLEPGKPVVVTAAMRPLSAVSTDGPMNLVDALRVASADDADGREALVAMNGRIWSARDLTKARTAGADAFEGGGWGPLGMVDADGSVLFHRRESGPMPVLPVRATDDLPRVDVVVSYPGADGVLIDAAITAGAAGIVSAGTGAGFATPGEHEALQRAVAAGVMVCQSYRGTAGRVHCRPQLVRDGFLAGQTLGPFKCRILLSLALATGADTGQVQSFFDDVCGI